MTNEYYAPDNCAEKLRAEGKAYPRSGCDSCRKKLASKCPHGVYEKQESSVEPNVFSSPEGIFWVVLNGHLTVAECGSDGWRTIGCESTVSIDKVGPRVPIPVEVQQAFDKQKKG